MKSSIKTSPAVQIISEFVKLQNNLNCTFRQIYPNVIKSFSANCPRQGLLSLQEEKWTFDKHGVGVYFQSEKSYTVVDIHAGFVDYPQAFDAWRLVQYFESKGIEQIYYLTDVFDLTNKENNEDIVDDLLEHLLEDNIVEVVQSKLKLYGLKNTSTDARARILSQLSRLFNEGKE
ncbi:hypothetical protein Riv7116_5616 [Rivularia sp. PCC 7116]|uniref:DUF6896 domain-containing protein n=1 Tax=Rivularia sp. PCC 7116 TaxID=373994 RepID=UPI00029F2155|nr:hypothetical protein [Rivularia sp. PCC 7116]AFY57985.1 hypothetical protein Riv7116_5616 [Rivularia sp. PCC 7116]